MSNAENLGTGSTDSTTVVKVVCQRRVVFNSQRLVLHRGITQSHSYLFCSHPQLFFLLIRSPLLLSSGLALSSSLLAPLSSRSYQLNGLVQIKIELLLD